MNRDINFLVKHTLFHPFLNKYIFTQVKEIHNFISPSDYRQNYYTKNPYWILYNYYYELLRDKFRNQPNLNLDWDSYSFRLLVLNIKDESTIDLITDNIGIKYQNELFEASIKYDNILLFQKLLVVSVKKIIRDSSFISSLFTLAITNGRAAIAQYIIDKYTKSVIIVDQSLIKKAFNSNCHKCLLLALQVCHGEKFNIVSSGVQFSRILETNNLEMVKLFTFMYDKMDVNSDINTYVNRCVSSIDLNWERYNIIVYIYKDFLGNHIPDNLQSPYILDEKACPYQLKSHQVVYYSLYRLLQHLNIKKKEFFRILVSFNNIELNESLVDVNNDYFDVATKYNLFKYVVQYGDINSVTICAKHQRNRLLTITELSTKDSLQILKFLHTQTEFNVDLEGRALVIYHNFEHEFVNNK